MTKIGFIRHGCTAWNKERRSQGSSDIPLDHDGLMQANSLAERLGQEKWDIIYSSDLLRAKQTAEAIKNNKQNIELHLDPRLREVSGGQIEGTTETERVSRWGPNWRELDLGKESAESVLARGLSFLDEVIHKHDGKNILIVSHGSFIKHLLRELLPKLDVEESLGNCSVSELVKIKDGWEMELHNCTRHLIES